MTSPSGPERWELELQSVKAELAALREEQRQLAGSIEQLLATFRGLAQHLGVSTEPYGRRSTGSGNRDLPGFA